jgi:hypothetical protein
MVYFESFFSLNPFWHTPNSSGHLRECPRQFVAGKGDERYQGERPQGGTWAWDSLEGHRGPRAEVSG